RARHRNGHGPLVTGAAPRATNGGEKARRAAAKRAEAEAKARRKADRKATAKADRKARRKAEKAEKVKAQADRKAQRKAEKAKAQADGKAQRKAEKKANAQAGRKAQRKAERKAKAKADRKAQRKADQKKAKATARGKADRMADDQAPRMEQDVEETAPHAGDRADVDLSPVGAEPSAGADGDARTPPPDVPDAETLPDGTDASAAAPADDDPSRALPDLPAVPAAAGRPDAVQAYPADELANDLLLARISRAIDDREIALQKQSRVFFQISGAGHEALLLGLAHELRAGYDWFFPYYRDLALMLGLGMSAEQILLQAVGSADDPASGGRQMPAHWGDRERNVVTQSSPTGSQCIPAVGCAEAGRYIVRRPDLGLPAHGDEVTYVSLGEGATSEGEFWESLNTACTEHLPVLFVVADNGYAISVPSSEQSPAPIHDLVKGFAGLQVWTIDGTDYFEVRRAAEAVVSHVRAGVGPALIHATVTRPYSHSAADTQSKYRLPHELAWEAENDPIERLEAALVDGGVISADQAAHLRDEARRIVADAAKAALARPRPDPACVLDHVVALPDIPDPGEVATGTEGDDVVAMGEAIRRTLHEVMDADERIRVFGEDVADAREAVLADVEGKGGVFGTTHGLQRDFGRARCYNTPLAEANIIGRAVGQAIRGLRPAPEIQFFDYIWPAMQQIRSEAATIRWRSNGAFTCPTVMRVPIGGYLQGGSIWHSQSGESIFAHIPGLLVAFPSRASDAAGLLRAAFRCEDPVLFLEHKHLLRQPYTRDPFPDDGFVVPFGKGRYVTRGTDLTIVTWGATVERSRLAAEQLAETDGASVEIVDLRTLVPWDQELVAESVAKTSRLLVVHEDVVRAGFGGEIAAWVAEQSFWQLDAPIGRVGAQECHVAYAPELENAILPQVDDIATAAHRLLCA
ncbi:MAG TPA: thiamine pyrophosphate-dependent enzyme, partial [Acidimicrobiales bacterium]|nr:thiamine pyrophosphate-dependent enzyme [Acidimicrobiales bacterium]